MKNILVKSKIVYTVSLGYHELKEPTYLNKSWDLICFTDRDITSKNWKIINVECDGDFRRKAREIKIKCDKFIDFDVCLFIDSKFTINCNLNDFIKKNLVNDIVLMDHNKRSCSYDEANFCIKQGIGKKDLIEKQINSYIKEGFPKKFGLYATGILIRRNTQEVINFMKQWYNEVEKYSCRDQISFPYVLWKNPMEIGLMPFKKTYARFK